MRRRTRLTPIWCPAASTWSWRIRSPSSKGSSRPTPARISSSWGPTYDPKYHGEGVGIALRQGEDDLRLALDEAIDKVRADGTYQAIKEKYFDFDVYGPTT